MRHGICIEDTKCHFFRGWSLVSPSQVPKFWWSPFDYGNKLIFEWSDKITDHCFEDVISTPEPHSMKVVNYLNLEGHWSVHKRKSLHKDIFMTSVKLFNCNMRIKQFEKIPMICNMKRCSGGGAGIRWI